MTTAIEKQSRMLSQLPSYIYPVLSHHRLAVQMLLREEDRTQNRVESTANNFWASSQYHSFSGSLFRTKGRAARNSQPCYSRRPVGENGAMDLLTSSSDLKFETSSVGSYTFMLDKPSCRQLRDLLMNFQGSIGL